MQFEETQEHEIKGIIILTVNTRIKMQHQLFAAEHKIHVPSFGPSKPQFYAQYEGSWKVRKFWHWLMKLGIINSPDL